MCVCVCVCVRQLMCLWLGVYASACVFTCSEGGWEVSRFPGLGLHGFGLRQHYVCVGHDKKKLTQCPLYRISSVAEDLIPLATSRSNELCV